MSSLGNLLGKDARGTPPGVGLATTGNTQISAGRHGWTRSVRLHPRFASLATPLGAGRIDRRYLNKPEPRVGTKVPQQGFEMVKEFYFSNHPQVQER